MTEEVQSRRASDAQLAELRCDVTQLKEQHTVLSNKLDINTAATTRIEENTKAIVETYQAIAGGMKVLGLLGKLAKYLTYIFTMIAAAGGAWYALTHWGQTPPIDMPK